MKYISYRTTRLACTCFIGLKSRVQFDFYIRIQWLRKKHVYYREIWCIDYIKKMN